jgi:hypothetical protein
LFLLQTTCRKLAKVSKSTENLGNKSAKTLTPQSHGTIQTSDWRNARQPKLSQKSDIKNSYTTKQAIGAIPASRNCRKKATSKTYTQPNKRLAQCPPTETVAKKRHQKRKVSLKADTAFKIALKFKEKRIGTVLEYTSTEPSQNMRANLFNHINTTNHETDTSFLRTRSADNEHSGHRMQKRRKPR